MRLPFRRRIDENGGDTDKAAASAAESGMRAETPKPEGARGRAKVVGLVTSAGGLEAFPKSEYPFGTRAPATALPRLVLGLTHKGSLVGRLRHVVQT